MTVRELVNKAVAEFERERIIGEITVYLPKPPAHIKIANSTLPKKKQMFYYTEQPKKGTEPTDEFLRQEFDRFQNGYWFMNNGKLEWITPNHYFFLNYWKDKGKQMRFIDSQREAFIWWWQIERMESMAGGNLVTNRRFGKALDVDTPIPTPNGWTTMGELKVGDLVFDSKGMPTNVTYVTEYQYDRECYDVRFSDGSSVIADAEHQWICHDKVSRSAMNHHPQWSHTKVVTTERIKNRLRVNKNQETNWSVVNCLPVQYEKKELKIPPYILGTWLGDGTSRATSLTSIDPEIFNAWKVYAEENDMVFKVCPQKDRCTTYRISGKTLKSNVSTNYFLIALQEYNLILNKHIPIDYLQSSEEDRMELLKGLMDTDGCVYSGGNCFEFCSKHEHLAKQLKELAESLGYKCVLANKLNKKYGTTFWYVRFGSTSVAPFKLKRKLDKIKINKRSGGIRYDHRYIIDVVPVESRPVKCITVDSEDSSYLCSNYITTHNTVVATCVLYWRTSTNANFRGGIQSKTNGDGKLVFNKLIKSWQKLPDWLKPVDSGETRPASVLDFTEPRSSIKKGKKVYEEVLDSSIDFKSSSADAYDGDELHTYLEDEIGKSIEVNTDERWGVVQFCLLIGSEIVGKAFRTTTVEEMEKKGGKNFKKTWDDSAIKTLDPDTGMTTSMLTNLFIPADYGYKGRHPITKEPFVDEYGYSNRALAKSYIESLWSKLEGDKLAAAQRKNPLVIKHAFQLQNFDSVFDNELLEIQKEYLENEAPKNLIRRVTFAKDEDGIVKWRDDPRGHFEMVWDFANQSEANKRIMGENGLWKPNNIANFAAGIDPFAATITTGPGSMGVCYIYKKGDPLDPENSGFAILRYAQRTKFKADFHKNIMNLCQYFGCKANYESDVDDYYEKFLESGFKNYVMWRPKSTVDPQRKNVKTKYGTPSKDPFALQKHTEVIDEYIKLRYDKIYFIELINQLIDYDIDDRTKFDDVIAFGMALIGGSEGTGRNNEPQKPLKLLEIKKSKKYY